MDKNTARVCNLCFGALLNQGFVLLIVAESHP
jgi:hypothetical protein